MSRRRAFELGLLLLGLSAFGCAGGQRSGPSSSDHPLLGAEAPALELSALDGQGRISLSAFSGKVVVVDFWATWCDPCRDSFPVYQRLVDEFGGEVVVVGVSVDEEPGGIRGFLQATGAKFPVGWDEGQTAARLYQPPTMPTSFVVDRHGIVRFVRVGFRPGDEAELRRDLQGLL